MINKANFLLDTVIEGIQERKGTNITVLDMSNVESSICDYFVICDGTSSTHVDSIADSIEEVVRVKSEEKPLHVEGRDNSLWVLVDYSNVIVHIFQRQVREFYALEDLWSDAKRLDIENVL